MKERGFTLPEILVVISIMIFMTVLVLPNWRRGSQELALDRALHQVAQDITRAEESALRAQFFQCQTGSIKGYGVYWDRTAMPDSYLIFADCNGNEQYDVSDTTVETVTIEDGVSISSLSPDPSFSIVFTPPEPRVVIKPTDPSQAQVVLALDSEPGTTRTLTVTSRGIIDIQ